MSGRWKKTIWALLMIQMCLLHVYLLCRIKYSASYYWYKGCVRLGLPYFLYDKGFCLVALGVSVVSVLMVVIFFIHYRGFRVQCISGIYPLEEEGIRHQYEEACIRAGITRAGRKLIYASPKVATPFVLGFYKPVILLPEWAKEEEMLAMLLTHECVHIRHKDTWYKLFLFLCNALCWYNPLAYLIRSISFRDIEIDCDEAVVSGYSREEREIYGQFLIDSLKRVQSREYVYSAFFSAGGRMMKARIAAVMENKRPYNALAGGVVALLVLETALVLSIGGRRFMENRRMEEAPENIYEGYEKPECFTAETLARMLTLAPAEEDSYRQDAGSMPYRDIEDYSELPYQAEGPWQVRLKDNHYVYCIDKLVYRYLNYDRDQTADSVVSMEDPGFYNPLEMVRFRMLAGDHKEFVFAVVLREYWSDANEMKEAPPFGQIEKVDGYYYAYYPLAVHVKMVKDSVFELQGITEMNQAVEAFKETYPDTDYSDIPYFTGKPKAGIESEYEARTSGGILEMRKRGQEEWETVPVSLEELFTRGDEMDGELTRLQDGSYQCDGIKQIFAYGGCGSYGRIQGLPVYVVYYDREAGAFRSSVVTKDYGSVRRLFVSFPENDRKGYLVLTSDRTMWHECTTCFVTEDGGKSWLECKIEEGGELTEHSLTMDMKFITNDIGFITIRSSGSPDVIRTKDGGTTWETVTFDTPKEYYSIAYAPFIENGKWTIDVGEEEYSKNGGIKARYVTEDMGKTWQFTGFVVKQ